MIFSANNKKVSNIPIHLNHHPINRVIKTKFLGVIIDYRLSWREHVNYTCNKLSKCFGILCKAKRILNRNTMINLYYTFIYPYYIYCNNIWGSTYKTHLDRLFILQKKFIRLITFSSYRSHTEPLFKETKILTLYQINYFMNALFVYKFINNELPHIFNDMFVFNHCIQLRQTRQSSHIRLPSFNIQATKHTLRYKGGHIWNNLPGSIKCAKSIGEFKRQLKHYLNDRNLHATK